MHTEVNMIPTYLFDWNGTRERKRHGLSNMQIAAANVVQLQLIGWISQKSTMCGDSCMVPSCHVSVFFYLFSFASFPTINLHLQLNDIRISRSRLPTSSR